MSNEENKVKGYVHPEDFCANYGCGDDGDYVNNNGCRGPLEKTKDINESIILLKEIINEIDCRDKVRKYLDLLEIPNRFFICMFGELVKIFGTRLFKPNLYYCCDPEDQERFAESESANHKIPYPKDYSYRDQIDAELTYEGGTGGWYNALKTTCWILDMGSLLDIYNELSWMNSDYFDEWVGDKIIKYLFEKDNYRDKDYEIFLKGKGVI